MLMVIKLYSYIKGIVTEIEVNCITLENNNIGYKIITPNPHIFKINEEYKIYIYEHVKEDELTLYGFQEKKEKELFIKLINVKGLGCKMALPILATDDINEVLNSIEQENINYLKKFPKIGEKVAKQIILDLKGKLVYQNQSNKELIDTLKCLGYKSNEINNILSKVNTKNSLEIQVKEALKLLLR